MAPGPSRRFPHARRGLAADSVAVGSSVIAFLVAGVLFMGAVTAVLVTTRTSTGREATSTEPEAAAFEIQADSLARLILGSPGFSGAVPFGLAAPANAYDGRLADADAVTRLGLLDPEAQQPNMMDFSKFQNLRRAPLAADPTDQYVNYREAAAALGLQGMDFHIRSYPTLASVEEMLASASNRDQTLRVAYIADAIPKQAGGGGGGGGSSANLNPTGLDFVDPSTLAVLTSPVTCGLSAANPGGYRLTATVQNGGSAATQFKAVFTLAFSNRDSETRSEFSPLVPAGGVYTFSVNAAHTAGRSCAGLQANLKLYDPLYLRKEATQTLAEPAGATPATVPRSLILEPSKENYRDSEDATFVYSGKGLAENDPLILTVCPGTTECRLGSDTTGLIYQITTPKQASKRNIDVPAASIGPTAASPMDVEFYTARLYDNADGDAEIESTSFRAEQQLLVTDPEPGPYVAPSGGGTTGYSASAAVAVETSFLNDLMAKFCPTYYSSTTESPLPAAEWDGGAVDWSARCSSFKTAAPHPGDVYTSDGNRLRQAIHDRLMTGTGGSGACKGTPTRQYTDILVIGSNVDHNDISGGEIKDCIEKWVLAGGTLIVLGSVDGKTEWMQSLFHVNTEGSSTGINVPDPGHPVLHTPNELNYPLYRQAMAWRLKETGSFDAENAFTRVVNEDSAADSNAVLAVSDPGDFEGGSVILSGWTPYDLDLPSGSLDLRLEGLRLMHNLLMLGYRDLYLDYGPRLPTHANVVPAIRSAQICHPAFDDPATVGVCDLPIDLRFLVYVFPS